MKFVITLLLSGISFTAALPTCTDEGIKKCLSYDPRTHDNPFVETEEDLNSFCKSLTCLIDFHEICGEARPEPDMTPMFKQYKVIFDNICDKASLVRQKYLENAECLNKEMESLDQKCPVEERIEMSDPKFCKNVVKIIDCSYDVIGKQCGEDAKDVYRAVYPGLEFFGCNK